MCTFKSYNKINQKIKNQNYDICDKCMTVWCMKSDVIWHCGSHSKHGGYTYQNHMF